MLPPSVVARSRALRQQAGEPERRLWRAVREAFPDAKFRRQVPFRSTDPDHPYHADFCSHSGRLIVEVDGDDHAQRTGRDAVRTRVLGIEGYRVVRVGNGDVMANLEGVITTIAEALQMRKGRP